MPLAGATPRQITLRLIATTDLHMCLTGPSMRVEDGALARAASVISQARADFADSLLFDNGDVLQGGATGEFFASEGVLWPGDVHPMIAAMNTLGYDAAALGNHDFDFGLGFLDQALAGARFPVLCANAEFATRPAWHRASALLDRDVTLPSGEARPLRIGVIGVAPPQTVTANWMALDGRMCMGAFTDAIGEQAAALRAQGADLVVGLIHAGFEGVDLEYGAAALPVAQSGDVDAMILGHTHERLPRDGDSRAEAVDLPAGRVAGVPSVMAGAHGSHIGLIDLRLDAGDGHWRIVGAESRLRRVAAGVQPDPGVVAACTPAVTAMRRALRQPVGRAETDLHSYFGQIAESLPMRISAAAKLWFAGCHLTAEAAGAPILSAEALFLAGGRGGPDNYCHIRPGPVRLADLAQICPYPDRLCGLRLTGGELRQWLNEGAKVFRPIDPGAAGDQPLIDPVLPSYRFTAIYGLECTIDPSREAAVAELTLKGRPVQDADRFVVLTSDYQAARLARLLGRMPDQLGAGEGGRIAGMIRDYLGSEDCAAWRDLLPAWRLAALGGVPVTFDTGPAAAEFTDEISAHRPELLGPTEAGFIRYRLFL